MATSSWEERRFRFTNFCDVATSARREFSEGRSQDTLEGKNFSKSCDLVAIHKGRESKFKRGTDETNSRGVVVFTKAQGGTSSRERKNSEVNPRSSFNLNPVLTVKITSSHIEPSRYGALDGLHQTTHQIWSVKRPRATCNAKHLFDCKKFGENSTYQI
jgi:hypothetical protein